MPKPDHEREESALRYSEENYRLVVETAPDAVISIDESGAILFANPASARIFGYDPAGLVGKPLTALMPEFLRKLHEQAFSRYLATGERLEYAQSFDELNEVIGGSAQ
jgi:PAS domain S-box-containing protein